MKPGGLGKGLAALIPNKREETSVRTNFEYQPQVQAEQRVDHTNKVMNISVEKIDRNPEQPRLDFSESDLQDLAASIREHGVLQPLLVTRNGDRFTLIAGERRLRASKRAGLAEVPCLIHGEVDDREQLELAIIENVQRADLNPMEQAIAYKKLNSEFGMTHEEIAKAVGKERPSISNIIRLLDLPEEIQKSVKDSKISFAQARTLLAVGDPAKQKEMFEKLLAGKMGIEELERSTRKVNVGSHTRTLQKDPQLAAYEEQIARALATRVHIKKIGEGGSIIVEYYSDEELSGIVQKISGSY